MDISRLSLVLLIMFQAAVGCNACSLAKFLNDPVVLHGFPELHQSFYGNLTRVFFAFLRALRRDAVIKGLVQPSLRQPQLPLPASLLFAVAHVLLAAAEVQQALSCRRVIEGELREVSPAALVHKSLGAAFVSMAEAIRVDRRVQGGVRGSGAAQSLVRALDFLPWFERVSIAEELDLEHAGEKRVSVLLVLYGFNAPPLKFNQN
mmetsp:Transcript_20829/g.69512  ORF Transcript_20829/g.69512 Transcript_20829/m.69512 type:complete len:205 (+) Transcript_20829:1055-1669(+)